uniref:Uncharacterized protein n=1 Tax=Sphingobacterium sp. (strain 21) TaxID=743722 RepID=F4CAD9_SPHS2
MSYRLERGILYELHEIGKGRLVRDSGSSPSEAVHGVALQSEYL